MFNASFRQQLTTGCDAVDVCLGKQMTTTSVFGYKFINAKYTRTEQRTLIQIRILTYIQKS